MIELEKWVLHPVGIVVILCVGFWIVRRIYKHITEPVEEQYNFDGVPDSYTTKNTQFGEIYPILGRSIEGNAFVVQEFMVTDKCNDLMYVSVHLPGGVDQGRPLMIGWIDQINSHKSILSSQLKRTAF